MVDNTLVELIKHELNEDLYNNYDGDYDTWSEVVLDTPSNSLVELFNQIPKEMIEQYFEEHIIPYVESLDPDNV